VRLVDLLMLFQQECHTFADPYVEHDSLTLLLDLILLKRGVYRHLLFNRGSKPHRAIKGPKAQSGDSGVGLDTSYLTRARWIWTLKLGASLIVLDACTSFAFNLMSSNQATFTVIRWTHLSWSSRILSLD
jgi:hypothetical protein